MLRVMEESKTKGDPVSPDVGVTSAPPAALASQKEDVWFSLVERMAAGDQEALSRLYDETSRVIYALALRILQNREDAEEAVIDCYSRAWRHAKNFDRSRASVMAWLVMMARSIAIDRIRGGVVRTQRTEPLPETPKYPSQQAGPEIEARFGQQRERIEYALRQLPAEQREVIQLAFFTGLSHSELAERLGAPLGTIKTRARLGLARLRTLLEDMA